MDTWILRLKAAYDAGYYKTEPAVDEQTLLPWPTQASRWRASWLIGPVLPAPESMPALPSPHDQPGLTPRNSDPRTATTSVVQAMMPPVRETFLSRCHRLLGRR